MSGNIKKWRKKRDISQEKLAELADISLQTVNCIEGCRTWVSDKTLAKLAGALDIEVFQLIEPPGTGDDGDIAADPALDRRLSRLRQEIKADVDARFSRFSTDEPMIS